MSTFVHMSTIQQATQTRWLDEDTRTWHQTLEFAVNGTPIPQGDLAAARNGKLYHKNKNLHPWRDLVSHMALQAMRTKTTPHGAPLELFRDAVALDITFILKRPLNTPKTRPTPPAIKKPDLDKLLRAIQDACTGIVYTDDSQVVESHIRKRIADHGENPGAHILITTNITTTTKKEQHP